MITGIIILGLLILFFLFIAKINRKVQQNGLSGTAGFQVPEKEQPVTINIADDDAVNAANTGLVFTDVWWMKLSDIHQLQLAVLLCKMALPVWGRYTSSTVITYKASAKDAVSKIDNKILETALEEINSLSRQHFPGRDNKKINCYYANFIGPVVAIQDGIWIPPYPVKKIFLAVYCILRSIVEQNNYSGTGNILSTAINQALDCMNITRLYSRQEIEVFLEGYKNKL